MEMLPFKNPLGKPPRYTPEQLAEKFSEYVQWCQDHPIELATTTTYANGNWAEVADKKPRLICLSGFELYAGVTDRWWAELAKRRRADDYARVKAEIKKLCETYQKEMASAGIFKENIISRLLGLADRQTQEQKIENRIVVENQDQAEKIKSIGEIG